MSCGTRNGSALIAVLAALALLLSLGVPFLMAGRLRSEASREAFERARARVVLESASRYGMLRAARSHPGVDPTPLWDAREEWDAGLGGALPAALGGGWERAGESWGLEVESLQSRVSLASAPPLVLQNLLHPCFVSADVDFAREELPVTSTAGFPETGRLLVRDRWVGYAGLRPTAFTGLEPDPEPPGSLDEVRFREGTAVIDARVFNLVLARMQQGGWAPPEFLADLFRDDWTGAGLLPESDRRRLQDLACLRAGAYGTGGFGPAHWLNRRINGDRPDLLPVSDGAGFSSGSVVRVDPEGGAPLDTVAHRSVPGRNLMRMAWEMPTGLEPFATRVRPLLREPVDLNSARPEVLEALAAGVRFGGALPVFSRGELPSGAARQWVTPAEARAFAARVVAARPLRGPEDLWERVLQPMEEEGRLTLLDAWALHLNGLDPNSGYLLQSTHPFGYRSGDAYLQRVDAAVRSRLGRTLGRAAARQTVRPAPDGPLLRVFQTQEEFDDAARWGRGARGTHTMPNNLGKLGGHGDFPGGLSLRTGSWEQTGLIQPSQRDEDSFVGPEPAQESSNFGFLGVGRTEHFHLEPFPFGWDVGEQGPLVEALSDWQLSGAAATSDSEPFHFQAWFDLTEGAGDQALFDITGPATDRQRIAGAIEGGFLVVRGWDNAGDDPLDPENLVQAVEVKIDPAEYPLAGRWLHLSVLVRGISPRGMQVAVDGVPRGAINSQTWLTAPLAAHVPGSRDQALLVESTEGFPDQGVLRVGDEVIEYSARTGNSFITARDQSAGPRGYRGGRAAREAGDILAGSLDSTHPDGAGVELYGYSAFLATDIPPGGGRLSGEVGPFSVAVGVEGEDPVSITTLDGQTIEVGRGFACSHTGQIELEPMSAGDPYFAEAFQSDGGYALLFQPATGWEDIDGCRIGGYEVIRYSSRTGTVLNVSQRNVTPSGLSAAPNWAYNGRAASFVTEWAAWVTESGGAAVGDLPEWRVFIMPISVKGSGVSDVFYLPPGDAFSEFVQLTPDGQSENTEWVRYDRILGGAFLRDEWSAIRRAVGTYVQDARLDVPPFPPGSGGPGGGGGGGNPGGGRPSRPGGGRPGGGSRPGGGMWLAWQQGQDPYQFARRLGEPVQNRDPEIERIRNAFQFRGVMGTYDHAQRTGTSLVPAFHTVRSGPWHAYPGRLDRVAVMQPGSSGPSEWYTVEWASAWKVDGRVRSGVTYVAFKETPGSPWLRTPNFDPTQPSFDPRQVARIVKFPSDERPEGLDTLTLGAHSAAQAPPFAGAIDEVSLHTVTGMGSPLDTLARGAFVLEADMDAATSGRFEVDKSELSVEGHRFYARAPGDFLQRIPDSGILDIDGERIGYESVDRGTGFFRIAPNGRGLHGTEPRGHSAGAYARVVDGRAASALVADLTADEAILTLEDAVRFPDRALLLVDQELIHTRFRGLGANELGMPRWRLPAGSTQAYGDGILRGRFGTAASPHQSGAIVYSFPCRWEDRYVPHSDSPAAAWFEIGIEEPDAFWRGVYFEAEVPHESHKIRVLARSGDASWEDVEGSPGLRVLTQGRAPGGGPAPLGLRGDRLDLRITFDWDVGAFDPLDFEATGWTSAPRLSRLAVDYLAEPRVERHQEVLQ